MITKRPINEGGNAMKVNFKSAAAEKGLGKSLCLLISAVIAASTITACANNNSNGADTDTGLAETAKEYENSLNEASTENSSAAQTEEKTETAAYLSGDSKSDDAELGNTTEISAYENSNNEASDKNSSVTQIEEKTETTTYLSGKPDSADVELGNVTEINAGDKTYVKGSAYGDLQSAPTLYITPHNGVDRGEYQIVVDITNGTFDKSAYDEFFYKSSMGKSYNEILRDHEAGISLTAVLQANMGDSSSDIPYKVVWVNSTQIKVTLFCISENLCDNDEISYDIPHYSIPMLATAGEDDVTVKVTSYTKYVPSGFTGCIAKVNK